MIENNQNGNDGDGPGTGESPPEAAAAPDGSTHSSEQASIRKAQETESSPPAYGEGHKKGKSKQRLLWCAAVLVVLAAVGGLFTWYQFFRDVPQPSWITEDPEANFLYGSIGSEGEAGIPYWIVRVLPRIFEDLLPGPGGYASLGMPWEEGKEFPAGFSKKTVGFERVGFNCALCHSTRYRTEPHETPTIVAAGGSHTADIQGLLGFFSKAASDSRFNAETILTQIDMAYPLSFLDRLLYKYLFIPLTKKQLTEQGEDFDWADSRPRWGPGRDAPMNLTKFNFLQMDRDDSIDNTDFPSIWHLSTRVQSGRVWPEDDYALTADWTTLDIEPDRLMLMNLAGDTTSFRSVLIDSALGLQAQNSRFFRQRMEDLEEWLVNLPPPDYPLPIDAGLASLGQALFDQHCSECHTSGRDNRLGTVIPLREVGTDPERTNAWPREAADLANQAVSDMGIRRTPMSKPDDPGYIALQLDGIWLRAPYLHNGSVPTLRALLDAVDARPAEFYRGYDVLDRCNVGFISRRSDLEEAHLPEQCADDESEWGYMPKSAGWPYETAERGNSNRGHLYGTELSPEQKDALVEFMKTL